MARQIDATPCDNDAQWEMVFQDCDGSLRAIANALLSCSDCAAEVVRQARRRVRILDIPERFQLGFAKRTVVKMALAHVAACDDSHSSGSASLDDKTARIHALPSLERFVYSLQEILRYPKRDIALLVGISDERVDQLFELARRRLALRNDATGHSAQARQLLPGD